MLSRINDAINLQLLRFSEWFEDLSPIGRRIFITVGFVLLMTLGVRYGVFPSKRAYNHYHAPIHW